MSSVVAVTDARRAYGSTLALDGASMQLRRGEWLGLLGPNGAGKTTLIRAVCGRVRLDSGTVTLLDRTVNANGQISLDVEARRCIGLVPQEVAVYPLLTATENLRAFGELNGLGGPELRQRVEWALAWTGLADRAGSLVKTFSGGMKRRLNIACGVLHRPEVVLLDEPTVGVDPQSRQRIWEMLSELRHQGASLLLTTHQLDEAQQVCDRIVIIDHGRTIAEGTLDELVEKTIGRGRVVTLTLDRQPNGSLLHEGIVVEGRTVRRQVNDVAAELPSLLLRIGNSGAVVQDVKIDAPNLQAVFIHLTGRELRE